MLPAGKKKLCAGFTATIIYRNSEKSYVVMNNDSISFQNVHDKATTMSVLIEPKCLVSLYTNFGVI